MCIFCRIANGELPASVVYEDAHTIAFLDIQPFTPGHVLVIPKQHAASLGNLSPEEAGYVMRASQIVAVALKKSGLMCEGVNFWLSDGKAAGQEVDHIHMHVFPRFPGDGFTPPTVSVEKVKQPGRAQLVQQAKMIEEAIRLVSGHFSTSDRVV